MADIAADPDITTPAKAPGFAATLLGSQGVQYFAARLGARLAALSGKPFRLGRRVVAARHDHVRELLARDLDFTIAPVNEAKVDEVNGGPFVLGMDRSARLERERRALYAALHSVDLDQIRAAVAADILMRLDSVAPGGTLNVVNGYARPIAARTAQRLFGLTSVDLPPFMAAVRSVFAHTFLNIGNDAAIRDRAVRAGRLMQSWLAAEIAARRAGGRDAPDMMGALMRQGIVDDDGVRRTLGGMLVGSIDTTATAVAKTLAVAGRDPELRAAMVRDRDDLDKLNDWSNEALRRWPHNPILLRHAAVDTLLAGRAVKAGDAVIAWTHAAMQDPQAFPDPRDLRAGRSGAAYLHLGTGLHPCAGRPVNRLQIPLLLQGLLRRGVGKIGKIGWAGPFPDRLMVTFAKEPR